MKFNITDNIHLKRHQEHLKARQTQEEEKENLATATFGDAERPIEERPQAEKQQLNELRLENKCEDNNSKMAKKSKLQDILEKKLRKQSVVKGPKPKERELPTEADVPPADLKEAVPEEEFLKMKESKVSFKIKSLRQDDVSDALMNSKNQAPEVERMRSELNNLKNSSNSVCSPKAPEVKLNGFLHPSCIYLPIANEITDMEAFLTSPLPSFKTLELLIKKDTKSFFGGFFPVFHVSFMVE